MTDMTTADRRTRVLFISYAFPPVGGAGVQRVTKFIKYLADTGWDASVLTVANPSVPVMDHSLIAELPPQTHIVRARTFEPSYAAKHAISSGHAALTRGKAMLRKLAAGVLQPDPQVLWMPAAWRAATHLLRRTQHDAIIASGPPFSSFLLGAALSRRSGLPLILDYRDEWDLTNQYWENKQLGALSLRLQRAMQRHTIRRAEALVATTRGSAEAIAAIRDAAGSRARVTWIYNGFDPSDFRRVATPSTSTRCRLVYTGTLWNLMSLRPLVDAVRRLRESEPHVADALEVVVAGRAIGHEAAVVTELGRWCRVVSHDYLQHADAVSLMQSADALCIVLSDVPGMERWVPAKTFEYMAARRPILALIPDGELQSLLAGHPCADVCAPGDVAGIAATLSRMVASWQRGERRGVGAWTPDGFDRPSQARELATVLDGVSARKPADAVVAGLTGAGELV